MAQIPGKRKLDEEWKRITTMFMSAIERGDTSAFKTAYSQLDDFIGELRTSGRLSYIEIKQPLGKMYSNQMLANGGAVLRHIFTESKLEQLAEKIEGKFVTVLGASVHEISASINAMLVKQILKNTDAAKHRVTLGDHNPLRVWFY